ncbi:sorbitol dehydrogenase [Stemphylium lycopersici]|uniref:Sorbitol dehydrogenase n=1 Tax=Stemphylium lycopersici TaxID=183478 RepID=A0A364N4L8_STELY|nr:sorbitol dehydrogenase [Stemphylium lycopersici]RAR11731.1 sorbitol dehydrogenase [Stemphylium lycopersici]
MAPSALADIYPIPARHYAKASTVVASVLHGPRDLRLETRTISDPAANEVQIAIKATGLCGSDCSYYSKFRNGDLQACEPLSLGHESAGVVVAIGNNVTGYQIGDRVALEVGVPCDNCRSCQRGRYNLCPKMRFRSSAKSVPHFQGTLQERINHPAKWCHKLPSHVSMESAALLEPLSVAIHATRRAQIEQGDTAIVFGAGTVGLLTAAMAKVSGATTVVIADIDYGRINYALANGFAHKGYIVTPQVQATETADKFPVAKELAADIMQIASLNDAEFEGADVTFDCTGKEVCMQAGLYATRPGGKLIMVGMGTPIQTLPMSASHLKEVDIIGIFRYANTYPTGIKILSAGVLPSLDNMITHRAIMAESTGNPLVSTTRASDASPTVQLHPLVLLTITDCVTRHTLRQQNGPVVGAILGAQDGQNITMEVAFQAKLQSNQDGETTLDDVWFSKRIEDFKDVHKEPQLDIVGWFTLGPASGPEPHILPIHSRISDVYTESPLLVLFHPENAFSEETAAGKLPLTVYESVSVNASSEPNDKAMDIDGAVQAKSIKFRELVYSIETGEAEMISVDFVARGGGNATAVEGSSDVTSSSPDSSKIDEGLGKRSTRGKQKEKEKEKDDAPIEESFTLNADDEEILSSLTAKMNAIRMLGRRIALLREYLNSLPPSYLSDSSLPINPTPDEQHPLPLNHSILRSVSATLARINILAPPDSAAFALESQQEASDVQLVNLLSSITNSVSAAKEFGRKSAIVEHGKSQGKNRMGAMGGYGGGGGGYGSGGYGGGGNDNFFGTVMSGGSGADRW